MSNPNVSINFDPEFFHGLTFWGEKVSAQVREASSSPEYRACLIIHELRDSDEGNQGNHGIFLPMPDVIRLRDLLNVATARKLL